MQPFADEADRLQPADAEVWDAHTHLGLDEDGMRLDPERLIRMMDRSGVVRSVVFPLHDPERRPAYRVPNDRVLAWASDSDDRLVPFCRLDPADDPIPEAERCLALGARGIKLHPRAQAFDFAHTAMEDIFRVAHEANVPILIHAGRGLPPIADALCDLAMRVPAPLILAHAGIADQATFATRLADHPCALFDTSVFGPLDMAELLARVSPERIVFASDPPYGRPLIARYMLLRLARASGLDDDALRLMMGGTIAAVVSGSAPAAASALARPRSITMAGPLARLYVLLFATLSSFIVGDERNGLTTLALAEGVCRDPDPGPAAATLARVTPSLEAAGRAAAAGERVPLDLLHLAMTATVSPEIDAV